MLLGICVCIASEQFDLLAPPPSHPGTHVNPSFFNKDAQRDLPDHDDHSRYACAYCCSCMIVFLLCSNTCRHSLMLTLTHFGNLSGRNHRGRGRDAERDERRDNENDMGTEDKDAFHEDVADAPKSPTATAT